MTVADPVEVNCSGKLNSWCKKYLLEGQYIDEEQKQKVEQLPENPTFYQLITIKYRKFLAVLVPLLLTQTVWWSVAIKYNFFPWYAEYWAMPTVMLIGSIIAGMTSEGAGAVAFPVMTLALHLAPEIARDFSLMIQSIGMTSALVCTLLMRITFEERAVFLGIVGGVPGFIIGVHFIDPLFTGPQKKMLFVSIWTSFAFALAILNAQKKRPTFTEIPEFCVWKGVVLFFVGALGGIFDAFAGSGIDICIFAVSTLLFRVSEKVVTPTTIILKGVISVFGFYYRAVIMGDVHEIAWKYFACTIPVASILAPIGSFLGSHLHRQVVAFLIYILEVVSLIGFLFSKPSWILILIGGWSKSLFFNFLYTAIIIFGGYFFFSWLSNTGRKLMETIEARRNEKIVVRI